MSRDSGFYGLDGPNQSALLFQRDIQRRRRYREEIESTYNDDPMLEIDNMIVNNNITLTDEQFKELLRAIKNKD